MKGFLFNTFPIILIDDFQINLCAHAYSCNILSDSMQTNMLKFIISDSSNIIYIHDEDLYNKIDTLWKAEEDELLKELINTVKQYENESIRKQRLNQIREIISKPLDDIYS